MISANDHVDDMLERYPELNIILMRMGIMCVQCGEVFWGTLGELISSKGLNVDKVVGELNDQIDGENGASA